MKKLGLIGFPLTHSFSEKYFRDKFLQEGIIGYEYRNYPIRQILELETLIRDVPGLTGLNVTIPYKEQVIPFLADLDETAGKVGAVNTIRIEREGDSIRLTGYNTDVPGFLNSLKPFVDSAHRHALILGTGGASKAVRYALGQLGIASQVVSRHPAEGQMHYRDLCLPIMKKNLLIINTTPLGTSPDISTYPDIPYDLVSGRHILYDLVYNPAETEFLRLGRQKGATTINGLRMLELQAEASWRIWTRQK